MREDTKEITDKLDEVDRFVEVGMFENARLALAEIDNLVNQWAERNLSP